MLETFVATLAMMSFIALIGPIARVLGLVPWQAGTAISVGGIAWVLFARVWGAGSDRHGRRRILLAGVGGFALFYAVLCAFVDVALALRPPAVLAFIGIVLLRGIAGAFYAAVPATTAALVADHVPPERRAGALATIGAASAIGMVVGPGMAGLLAAYGLGVPLYLTAALPVLSFAVLWWTLPRHVHRAPSEAAPLRIADRRLRRPLAVAFVAMFSVAIAQVTVGFFALDRLHLDATEAARAAGIALTSVGIALVLAQVLVRALHWPPARLIRIGGTVSALGFASVAFATTPPLLWIGYFVAAAGMGWVFPSVSALAANAVEAHEQGAAAGTVSAAHGLGMIAGPIAGTLVYAIDTAAPYVTIAAMLVIAALWPGRRGPSKAG